MEFRKAIKEIAAVKEGRRRSKNSERGGF